MRRFVLTAFLATFLLLGAAGAARAQTTPTLGEKQIGITGCTNTANNADFDTIAQCTATSGSGTYQKAPLFVGAVTSPPYASTGCDSTKAGMLQYTTASGFQGCNGQTWVTFTFVSAFSGAGTPGNPWIYNNGNYASCYQIQQQGGATTGSGVYTITLLSGKTNVYCDMVTNGGGWTLVVGISGSNAAHANTAAITPANLTSTAGLGKFADTDINALKSGANPAYRLTCASTTGYFQTGCNFASTTIASGSCLAVSYTYGGSYSGSTPQTNILGLADGNTTPANRLIYADPADGSNTYGCDTASPVWHNSGTLWVR